ncbi:MAG: class I SAM-dependent methyltransferase [Candidatus Thorarchaeota archaeon]|nr:MAG: class I SAM-dependent methyltransferase [Candidatus Thorarchaeota archaeon]
MSSFDEIALAYDNSIDWNARLKREMPFLVESLEKSGGNHVLDMACGTGRHSVELAAQELKAVGFDCSQAMIGFATSLAQERELAVDFQVADMLDFRFSIYGPFDLAFCLGNSLALLPSMADLKQVVTNAYSVLRLGGTFIAQVLNFKEILSTGFRFFPIKGGVTRKNEDVIFSRFYEHGEGDHSTLVACSFVKQNRDWVTSISTQSVLHTELELMRGALESAGFSELEFFSDYSKNPFHPEFSRNLVVRAGRPERNE